MKEKSLRSVDDLVAAGQLPADGAAELRAVADRFAVEVSPAMVAIIRTAGPDSPVGQQFIPDRRELTIDPTERHDPIGAGTNAGGASAYRLSKVTASSSEC